LGENIKSGEPLAHNSGFFSKEMAMNEKLTLSTQLVNQILGYLGSRPYQETFQIIEALQKEAQASIGQPEKVAAEPVN
jgi:hypothetical protein